MVENSLQLGNRRVLVTGASGFIGSHLCRRLATLGAEVHAVSRDPKGQQTGAKWWQCDLTDLQRVKDIFANVRPELIYHLASCVTGSRDLSMVLPILRANLVSAVNLMTGAAEGGCPRIVLAGSLEEPQGADPVPSSPYAAAKWAASGYARMFEALYAVQTISLRIGMVYGPGQADASKLIPYVIRSLLDGETPKLSSGQRDVDWIYVDDVVDAMVACAFITDTGGFTVEIGSGSQVSVSEIAERLCQLISPSMHPILGALEDRPRDRSWSADVAPAREKLGWQPCTSLDDGLRKTVDWYRCAENHRGADK